MKKERKEQIIDIIFRIHKVWQKNSDLRLGQLILNTDSGIDFYYLEDDALIERLESFYAKTKTKSKNKKK